MAVKILCNAPICQNKSANGIPGTANGRSVSSITNIKDFSDAEKENAFDKGSWFIPCVKTGGTILHCMEATKVFFLFLHGISCPKAYF